MAKKSSSGRRTPTTATAVARIDRAVAKQNGGAVPKGTYAGRMKRTVAKNVGNGRSTK